MFTIYGGKTEFNQWEQGHRVTNPKLAVGDKVRFWNASGETHPMIAYQHEGVVVADVPNDLLQHYSPILVELCGDPECLTRFPVNFVSDKKPADYNFIDNTHCEPAPSGGGLTELPEGYPYKEGSKTVIEWDGNTEGKFFFGNEVSGACKVSNETFDDLSGFPITFMWGDESEELTLSEGVEAMSNVYMYATSAAQTTVLVVLGENAQNLETGTYFFVGSEYGYAKYVSKLTVSTETIHTIAPEYLPEGYPYKEKSETVIFEKQTLAFQSMGGFGVAQTTVIPAEAGKEYIVSFDGEIYRCAAFMAAGMSGGETPTVGNAGQLGGEDTGEPFLITFANNKTEVYSFVAGETHELQISELSETIQPMAEEFMPLLTSPNGTKYKLTVSDDGTLSAVKV